MADYVGLLQNVISSLNKLTENGIKLEENTQLLADVDTHIQSLLQALNTGIGTINEQLSQVITRIDQALTKLDSIITNTTPVTPSA